jgi:hypothetical protein
MERADQRSIACAEEMKAQMATITPRDFILIVIEISCLVAKRKGQSH